MAAVVEIWRYPVKSMAGERLESCMVTQHGLEGDRRWAFVDGAPHRAGKLFNIKQHDPLMTYRARYAGGQALRQPTYCRVQAVKPGPAA